MKKMHTRLLAGLLSFSCAMAVSAQTQYYEVEAEPVTTIETGQNYALHPGYYSSSLNYIHGIDLSTTVDEQSALQFEDAGRNDEGEQTYYLKQSLTGRYLQSSALQSGNSRIVWVDSKSRAWRFTAKQGIPSNKSMADIRKEGEEVDYSTYYYAKDASAERPGCFVFARSDWRNGDQSGVWLSGYSYPSWSPLYTNTCMWLVYKTTKATAYNSLCYAYAAYFGNGQTAESYFKPGTTAGCISQELFDAFKAAADELTRLYSDNTQPDDVYTRAQKAFEEAYAAAKAGVIMMAPGYYVIRNFMSDRSDGNGCIYDDGSGLLWGKMEYDGTRELTAADAAYVWQVEKAEGGQTYYLHNYLTGRYAGKMANTSTTVPSTVRPEQDYYIDLQKEGVFKIYTKGVNNSYPALHAQMSGNKVVVWNASSDASGWYFVPISADALQSMSAGIAQANLNKQGSASLADAQIALAKGISVSSSASRDGLYDDPGFITDGSRFWTNAQETKETNATYPENGYPQMLADNNQSTYFHSSWSSATYADRTHYIAVDLGEALQYLTLKYSRRDTNPGGSAKTIHVFAVNDTTGTAAGTCPWVDQGYVDLAYTYPANDTYKTPGAENFTGLTSLALDAPYKYLRLDVVHTMNDGRTNGNLYFAMSELHLYKGTYDPATSLLEVVPKAVTAELRTQIAAMKAQLEAGKVDQATLDALKAALQTYNDNLPDPAAVRTLIADARAQLDAAEEGEGLGYFKAGSKAVFESDIQAVEAGVKDLMNISEVNAAKAALNKAVATFNAALIKPADGAIVYIKCATASDAEGSAAGNYVYAANSDSSNVYWGGAGDEDLSERLNFLWRVVANGDGTYSFRNLVNGTYLGNPEQNDVKLFMSLTPKRVWLRSAKAAGLFNFVCTDGIYYNAQPGTNLVVTWSSASGADNSAFGFEPVDASLWMNTYHVDLAPKTQIVTLPIAVTGLTTNGKTYSVMGLNGSNIELKAYGDEEVIPAGTPFVYVPNAGTESETNDFMPTASSLADVTPVSAPLSATGLQGTLTATKPGAGVGLIFSSGVIISMAGDVVSANSGWFTDAMPATTATGDLSLPVDGVITAISAPALTPAARVDVYTLTGVAVRRGVKSATATRGLPAGLYIVGGRKVLVK